MAKTKTKAMKAPAAKEYPFHPCVPVRLPAALEAQAAAYAIKQNPANAPPPGFLAAMAMNAVVGADGGPVPISRMLVSRYWGGGGVDLTVSFMEQTSARLQDKILEFANKWNEDGDWGQGANIHFHRVDSGGDVRITRARGGYWSHMGPDIRQIPTGQPTMGLEGFGINTPLEEYWRVVMHEFAHTWGAHHEHNRRKIIARLHGERTVAYFERHQGWTRQEVYQQVLTPIDESNLPVAPSPNTDEESIMAYQLPAEITIDGRPIKGGSRPTLTDRETARRVYPKPGAPQPPTKPAASGWWIGVYDEKNELQYRYPSA